MTTAANFDATHKSAMAAVAAVSILRFAASSPEFASMSATDQLEAAQEAASRSAARLCERAGVTDAVDVAEVREAAELMVKLVSEEDLDALRVVRMVMEKQSS